VRRGGRGGAGEEGPVGGAPSEGEDGGGVRGDSAQLPARPGMSMRVRRRRDGKAEHGGADDEGRREGTNGMPAEVKRAGSQRKWRRREGCAGSAEGAC
jgi:hypothetical protein